MVRSGSDGLGLVCTEGNGIAGVFVRTGAADAGPDTTVTVPVDPWLGGVNVLREGADVGIAVVGGEAAGGEPDGVKVRVGVAGRTVDAPVGEPAGDEPEGVKVRAGVASPVACVPVGVAAGDG